jgi:hypothetical protein
MSKMRYFGLKIEDLARKNELKGKIGKREGFQNGEKGSSLKK